MKAVVVREHGGPETLSQEDLPVPEPGPGEVRVRVEACGVNHLDIWVRRGVPGHTFPLPLILGSDPVGTVDALGPGVDDLEVGAEVVVAPGQSCGHCLACSSGRDHHCPEYAILGEHRDGGLAEALCVPRANIIHKPASLSFHDAAAVGIAHLTAWHMLVDRAEVRAGETVLVQAAGSGVSSAAIQIAKLMGAEVIATSGSEDKLAAARQLGADHALSYREPGLAKQVKKITQGRGAQVVIDHVGAATWEESIRALAWQGRFVTCGATTGADVQMNLRHVFFKSLSILGATMGSRASLIEILGHVAAGRLKPVVDRVMPMGQTADAHQLIEERKVFGKVVLTPNEA